VQHKPIPQGKKALDKKTAATRPARSNLPMNAKKPWRGERYPPKNSLRRLSLRRFCRLLPHQRQSRVLEDALRRLKSLQDHRLRRFYTARGQKRHRLPACGDEPRRYLIKAHPSTIPARGLGKTSLEAIQNLRSRNRSPFSTRSSRRPNPGHHARAKASADRVSRPAFHLASQKQRLNP